MDMDRLKSALFASISAALAVLTSLPLAIQALLALMTLDLLAGALVAWQAGRVSVGVAAAGVNRKVLTVLAVLAAGALQLVFGDQVPAVQFVAGFYCWVEATSLLRNLKAGGVPIPPALASALARPPTTPPPARPRRP